MAKTTGWKGVGAIFIEIGVLFIVAGICLSILVLTDFSIGLIVIGITMILIGRFVFKYMGHGMRVRTVVIIAIMIIAAVAIATDEPKKPRKTTPKAGVLVVAEYAVKRALKSPSTADFPYLGNSLKYDAEENIYSISSYVDSQNGFGATVRARFFIAYRPVEDCANYSADACWEQVGDIIFL